jgi:hypothetical protein
MPQENNVKSLVKEYQTRFKISEFDAWTRVLAEFRALVGVYFASVTDASNDWMLEELQAESDSQTLDSELDAEIAAALADETIGQPPVKTIPFRNNQTREVRQATSIEDAKKQIIALTLSVKQPRIVQGGREIHVYFDDRFDKYDYSWSINGSY